MLAGFEFMFLSYNQLFYFGYYTVNILQLMFVQLYLHLLDYRHTFAMLGVQAQSFFYILNTFSIHMHVYHERFRGLLCWFAGGVGILGSRDICRRTRA